MSAVCHIWLSNTVAVVSLANNPAAVKAVRTVACHILRTVACHIRLLKIPVSSYQVVIYTLKFIVFLNGTQTAKADTCEVDKQMNKAMKINDI